MNKMKLSFYKTVSAIAAIDVLLSGAISFHGSQLAAAAFLLPEVLQVEFFSARVNG